MSELPKYLEELCEVKLSPKEIETASDAFVQACNSEAAAKIEHKNTMDAIKETKEAAFLLMTKKRESRLVRCLADWNYPVSGRVTLTRTDTHETIERKMTTEETSPFLPMAKKTEAKPEEAAPAAESTEEDQPSRSEAEAGEATAPQLLLGHDPSVIIDAEVVSDDPSDKPDPLAGKVDCDNCGTEHDHGKLCPWCFRVEEFEDDWQALGRASSREEAVLRFTWSDSEDDKAREVIGDHLIAKRDDALAMCGEPRLENPVLEGIPADRCVCSDCLKEAESRINYALHNRLVLAWEKTSVAKPAHLADESGLTHLHINRYSKSFCGRLGSIDAADGFPADPASECPECLRLGQSILFNLSQKPEPSKAAKKPKAAKAEKVDPVTIAVESCGQDLHKANTKLRSLLGRPADAHEQDLLDQAFAKKYPQYFKVLGLEDTATPTVPEAKSETETQEEA